MQGSDTLEQALADMRGDLAVLRRNGQRTIPLDVYEKAIERVASTASDYLKFVSEKEAMVRADKSSDWFRTRFPEWERQGNARKNPLNPRERQYRLLIVPVAARLSAIKADAAKTARGE